ncbi:unnamed protein product [Didymodactylos carnosus]|uniref:Serpin domain-containing protein n=1 Tax=Didymodactylos carnosus TaxID=1234261 RepID=A0A813VP90_9BILA|nr:unnamed protein product [Didymodactylos carnosus]CAF1007239.1 unnamed protein product [Didymodactylos carnosus]CAF3627748.1 unnamed protein product [Didymodactylos carnosus]CAF3776253.1 unnamed protein product [Didymodactylos carnosus]
MHMGKCLKNGAGFDLNLYNTVVQSTPTQNIFLSPASISLALGMTAAGAGGSTLKQMLTVLNVKTLDELSKRSTQISAFITSATDDEKMKIKVANRLYIQKKFSVKQNYMDLLQSTYMSSIERVDFETNPSATVNLINSWVESQTNNMIKDLLSSDDVNSGTRLILVNCIYFKGQWVKSFNADETTKDNQFYLEDGTTIPDYTLMVQKQKFNYVDATNELNARILHIPYQNSKNDMNFVFTIILPNENEKLANVESKLLNDKTLKQLNKNQEKTVVKLYLPKFKMDYELSVKETLNKLGIQDAFDGNRADFSGITGDQSLFLSDIKHKARIEVTELGTEAAAATAAIIMMKAAIQRPQLIEFRCDRPFLFMIREQNSDITLFQGRFMKPVAAE